jgi:TfoX/Sxy family transcriptional regulator of competence genes
MAYSEELADRIRAELSSRDDVVEKKMFGGIAFMVAGSMAVGIIGKDLMARVGPDNYERALARPHADLMKFTGRPLSGFVLVNAKGIATRATLKKWIAETVAFALTLPKKKPKKKSAAKTKSGARR